MPLFSPSRKRSFPALLTEFIELNYNFIIFICVILFKLKAKLVNRVDLATEHDANENTANLVGHCDQLTTIAAAMEIIVLLLNRIFTSYNYYCEKVFILACS